MLAKFSHVSENRVVKNDKTLIGNLLCGPCFQLSSGARCFYLVIFHPQEEPKKVRFDYDLFLHLEGHPPVNHLRCEKLTFNNPTEEFRRKLLKAGGVSPAPMSKAITLKMLLLAADV